MTNSNHKILGEREDMKIITLCPNQGELLEGQEMCPKHCMKIQIYITLNLYVYMDIV